MTRINNMSITDYENKAINLNSKRLKMPMKLKVNVSLRGAPAGSVILIQTDNDGIPLDRYWRRRLVDAKIDNCVEVVSESGTVPEKRKKGGK
jgi:hypothetical protein